MKTALLSLLLLQFAPPGFASSGTFSKADALFGKKLYQEALAEYEAAARTVSGEALYRAQYRAAECKTLLFRYGEALQDVSDWKMPQDALWKARYLILKTELSREYVKQYGSSGPQDVVEGEPDVTRKTPKEMHAEIRAGYDGLAGLFQDMAKRPLEDEKDFVDAEDARNAEHPTLFDFVILRWTDYLLNEAPEEKAAKPKASALLGDRCSLDDDPSLRSIPIRRAIALFEAAQAMPGAKRGEAVEWWKLRRLLLPIEHPGRFEWLKDDKDRKPEWDLAIATLRGWMSGFTHPETKAKAGCEAASLLYQTGSAGPALELCRAVERGYPGTSGSGQCRRLRGQILMPELALVDALDSQGHAPFVVTRNLREAYFRLYRASPEALLGLRRHEYQKSWSQNLNSPDKEIIEHFLAQERPIKEWRDDVKFSKPEGLYSERSEKAALPQLETGLYLLVASDSRDFKPGESLLSAVFVNRTDLVLAGASGLQAREQDMIYVPSGKNSRRVPGFHFYALDARKGLPVSGATISIQVRSRGQQEEKVVETGNDGAAQLPVAIDLQPGGGNYFSVDALARRGESIAYWPGQAYLNYQVPQPIQVFVDTDRPIYRPGQKVLLKVTVAARHPEGLKAYRGKARVDLRVRDHNRQEIYKAELLINAMGSASAGFVVPKGRLLGRYHVSAAVRDWGYSSSGSGSFSVEEYKRPEFETSLEDAAGPWRFGQPAQIKGNVRYYFGGPVPNAPVTARISRENYVPWFCWWWLWRPGRSGRTEVDKIDLKTDAKGRFTIDFTPEASDPHEPDPLPARFLVEVEARDPGGRTITGSKTYVAGKNAYLFGIEFPAGFLMEDKPSDISVKLMNLSEQQVQGQARYALYRLRGDPAQEVKDPSWGRFVESPSLERIYKDVPDGKMVSEGSLRSDGKKPALLHVKGLSAGAYRLTLKAEDPWGAAVTQSVIALVVPVSGKSGLKIPSLTLAEHPEYQVGEKALLLMGSADIQEALFVEVWAGQFLAERRMLRGAGIRIFNLPVTAEYRGGFTVRWFGVSDFRVRSGQVFVRVPRKEKELLVKLRYDKVLRPGQNAVWSIGAKDSDNKGIDGEALVSMYDRSLDYYSASAASWVKSLYPAHPMPHNAVSSVFQSAAGSIPVETGWVKKILELFQTAIREPQPPMLRLNKARVHGRWNMLGGLKSRSLGASGAMVEAEMAQDAMPAEPMMRKSMAPQEAMEGSEKALKHESTMPAGEAVAPRVNFAETAVFLPQLRIRNGQASFPFKVPEQLTSWRILGHVFTRDMKTGVFSEESLTRKDLMVRVDMPRFFREGDLGTLKALVHNETAALMRAAVTLVVTQEGKPAAERLGLKKMEREVSVPAHGVAALSWSLQAPREVSTYKIRAIARSAGLSDAEERELPILPSRQRLIETAVAALNGDASKVLNLKEFDVQDPSRRHESMHLQIDPQLALTVLNSLPFLVQYPHECVEQTLNRYVPMAIVHELYKRHPGLAAAASKIPKRKTITPEWDRFDPRRLMSLMESPWEEVSRGLKSAWPVFDMFDPAVVSFQKEEAMAKLGASQLPSGAFPWFAGGREDLYMTLYVLAGLAEAQHYGVAIPEDLARRALRYVNDEIPKQLKPREESLSLILYAAYVVTSFPQRYKEAKQGFIFARAWVDYADKHSDALTPYGKALAAFVHWRLGDKAKGDSYLDRALDGSRADPLTGVSWTPEKNSWLWYTDSVEKHAFFLRALQAIRPKDPRIPGMVQWLLFNRKGNEWKSTKASAAAIYALLDFMEESGALDRGDAFSVRWGGLAETVKVAPDAWLSKPMRWSRIGSAITPDSAKPEIEKRGPGFAFASLTWIYSTDKLAKSSGSGLLEMERLFYKRVKEGEDYRLKPLRSGDTVHAGDQIEVQIKIRSRSRFEYMQLKDPKAAGFEAEELLSGWKWDPLARYEEPRDSLTNFFLQWLPHGEYILRYRIRPTAPGRYRAGAAVLQSMYAPEFSAHSSGFELSVAE